MSSSDYRMTWNWVAGFTEGEGAIYFYRYEGRQGITCGLSWEQTVDELPSHTIVLLRDKLRMAGCFVSERKYRSANGKRWRHRVSVQNQTDVIRVLKKLIPHLLDKQDHARNVLACIQEWQKIGGRPGAVGRVNTHMMKADK